MLEKFCLKLSFLYNQVIGVVVDESDYVVNWYVFYCWLPFDKIFM